MLSDAAPKKSRQFLPPALDFFAGSGLVTEGLRRSFSVVWANDISEKKAAIYRANHPNEEFALCDVARVHGNALPTVALSWASFPCQDLSLAGRLGGLGSSRSGLFWQWVRVMDEMRTRPPLLVAENVLGLVSAAGGIHYKAIHEALVERGYRVGAVVLDAIRWLPQSRPRVFVVAVLKSVSVDRLKSDKPMWCQPATIRRAAALVESFVWWRLPKPRARRKTLSDVVDFDAPTEPSAAARRTMGLIAPLHRSRLARIVNGSDAVFPAYRRTRNGRQVLELRFDDVAGCLRTPEGGSSRQMLVLRTEGKLKTRLLSVAEAAALMGAPKSYRIIGGYNDGYRAMGDAVAVPVVRHLARHLLTPLAYSALTQ